MKRYLRIAFYVVVGIFATAPLFVSAFSKAGTDVVTLLNFAAWTLVVVYVQSRLNLNANLIKTARTLGIDTRFKSLDKLLEVVIRQVNRKNNSFSVNLLEQRISSKEELSRTLERIVMLAYKLFDAESAELALFDKGTGLYHSALVIGTPMRTSSQAMLSGAAEGSETESRPDVLVQPLAFAGAILGTIRIALKSGVAPALVDQEIMRLLAVQASLALINAQYTDELMKMKRASDESMKAKTGFLANLSHEIRAPLGIMMNAVELVLDGLCGPVNKDQVETLKMVHTNGEHLLELVNDVLDYAKVEAGRMQPQKVDIVVQDLLRDVCNVVRAQADSKNHKLICRADDDAIAISCDRRHARQMLINLLTNAIKYTPDCGIIEVWSERIPGKKVKLHVKDSGVGIDASEREKVFAPFQRLENSYSLTQVGTGLGMSLTRKLAEVNEGAIDFSSAAGQGSDFWLLFPAIEVGSAILEKVEPQPVVARGKGEVVLVLEKDEGERTMIVRYLSHNGFKVAAASSKHEALEIFRSRKVDVAVIDNSAADASQEDIIRAIRESPQGAALPIVLVSSRAFVFDIEKYLKSGIDRCLIKPVKLGELGQICRQLIDGTFTGEVIDEFEKSVASEKKSDNKKKSLMRSRVINLEDVLQ